MAGRRAAEYGAARPGPNGSVKFGEAPATSSCAMPVMEEDNDQHQVSSRKAGGGSADFRSDLDHPRDSTGVPARRRL